MNSTSAWNWWAELMPYLFSIQSMRYEAIGYGCNTENYCSYLAQINRANNLSKVYLGLSGDYDSWSGSTRSALSNLQGAQALKVGVAIWDLIKEIKGLMNDINSLRRCYWS